MAWMVDRQDCAPEPLLLRQIVERVDGGLDLLEPLEQVERLRRT
jgi:hypothetical protein